MFLPELIEKTVPCCFAVHLLHEMRRIEIAFVRHNTNAVCNLQRCDCHLILSDAKRYHCARIPRTAIFFIILGGIRNISAVFAWQINACSMAESKSIRIFLPFGEPFTRTMKSGIINSQPECVTKKRVAGMRNREPEISGMTRPVFGTFYRSCATKINAMTIVSASFINDAF